MNVCYCYRFFLIIKTIKSSVFRTNMKGIVFREFMEMVGSTFGDEMAEKMVEDNDVATAYTLPLGRTITKNSLRWPSRSRTRLDCQLMHLSRRLEITCLVVSWNCYNFL